jgi:hypothetical protein
MLAYRRRHVRPLASVALALLLAGCTTFGPFSSREFSSASTGFQIRSPEGWHLLAAEPFDPQDLADRPLVLISKYADRAGDLSPHVQVLLLPRSSMPSAGALDLLDILAERLEEGFERFELVEQVHATHLGGAPAAHMKASYLTDLQPHTGDRTEVFLRMWIIPREQYHILIGMSAPRSGDDASVEEFAEILHSIRVSS